MKKGLVAIAKIVKPRGLRGEVVAEVLTDFPQRFETTSKVLMIDESGATSERTILDAWFQKDRVVLKFQGIDSVEDAESLRGFEVCITDDEVMPLEEGEFFDWELEGCEVVTTDGLELGKVTELLRTGGTEILVVEGGEKSFMIPFADSICPEIDVKKKRIVVDPPEGLLDF